MNASHGHFDVIIVGGGGSGLAAGVSCAEQGLRILLLEKRPEPGGTTGIAVGSFTASCTAQQRRKGIDDDPIAHNEDAGKFADPAIETRGNLILRAYFLSHAADTLDWLERMGLRFHGPSPEPPNRVSRMHNVVPNAKAYIVTLQARFRRLGGEIVTSANVKELLIEERRVIGVTAVVAGERRQFTAKRGVVLAAGDYANNGPMIGRHKGSSFAAIEGINPHATGDGHRLAETAGARLINMDVTYGPELRFIPPPRNPISQLLPSHGLVARCLGWMLPLTPRALVTAIVRRLLVTWQHPENALFADGAVLVNCQGERFCDETSWPDREIAVANQPGKTAYILLDEALCRRYSQWPHFISTAPEIAYAYVDDYLRLRPDVAVEGTTPANVAEKRGLDQDTMARTVLEHNCAQKRPLSGDRWILLGPVKAYFTTTEGGAAINQDFQVLDADNQPILGLYAVGQTGLGGQILWGHGLHIAWAITSGRLVGRVLADLSSSQHEP